MIEGARVALGPILPIDLPNLFVWSDDPAIARLNEPYIPKNLQRESDFWLNAAGDATRIFFAIRIRSSAEIIGHVQVMAISPIHRSAVLGILIGKPGDRGHGYGREAMGLAIDYCWRSLNLSRLTLNVHATNTPAIALYESLGFETEGVLRRALFIEGDWIDLRLMAIMQPGR
jgi:RimJ/RimL family protein N-acetyltransferase